MHTLLCQRLDEQRTCAIQDQLARTGDLSQFMDVINQRSLRSFLILYHSIIVCVQTCDCLKSKNATGNSVISHAISGDRRALSMLIFRVFRP